MARKQMLVVVHWTGVSTHVAFPPATATPLESTQAAVLHLSGGLQMTLEAGSTWHPSDGVVHLDGLHASVVTQVAGHEHANVAPEHVQKPPHVQRLELSGHKRR